MGLAEERVCELKIRIGTGGRGDGRSAGGRAAAIHVHLISVLAL